ncbi:hypothetical protein L2E82_48012 [Cichorium intybus]|uniref:Uncharacterized protein n=1 Tax=Cichorium intybus TaxID=13427 RepID=A0ACB8YWB5_CICIN|nr:hypothetical protein L2E82_48012 [Cichorium intybus]
MFKQSRIYQQLMCSIRNHGEPVSIKKDQFRVRFEEADGVLMGFDEVTIPNNPNEDENDGNLSSEDDFDDISSEEEVSEEGELADVSDEECEVEAAMFNENIEDNDDDILSRKDISVVDSTKRSEKGLKVYGPDDRRPIQMEPSEECNAPTSGNYKPIQCDTDQIQSKENPSPLNGCSDNLKALLSRVTPLKTKLEMIEKRKDTVIDSRERAMNKDLKNRFPQGSPRITRSKARMKSNSMEVGRLLRSRKMNLDSASSSSGFSSRLEEIGEGCGFKVSSDQGVKGNQ